MAAVALAQGIGTFRDVPANHYAGDAAQWAVQNRITYGCRDGAYFCPERPVDRAESVTFLHRYNNNVVSPLENRVRALEGRPSTGSGTGFLRVSAYMADNTIDRGGNNARCDTDTGPDRTTRYAFDWGLVLTESVD